VRAGRNPLGIALDDRPDAVDRRRQSKVCRRLRKLGIDPWEVVRELARRGTIEAAQLRLRVASQLAYWRAVTPVARRVDKLYEDYRQVASTADVAHLIPRGTRTRFETLRRYLLAPTRSVDVAVDGLNRLAGSAGGAGLDAKLGKVGIEKAARTKALNAVRRGVMPDVRAWLFHRFEPEIRYGVVTDLAGKHRTASPKIIARRATRKTNAETRKLAVLFLKAYFPVWERCTQESHVRSAVAPERLAKIGG
jgi:hypothetical protein